MVQLSIKEMQRCVSFVGLGLATLMWASPGRAGLAERYPGDVGIESDPAVVFAANFEEATVDDVAARWDDRSNTPGMSLDPDVSAASSGAQSLRMTSVIGQNTGGHLYKMLPQGYDTLHARFYVKFAADCHDVHHFVHMGGYNPPTRWPQGGAGVRPDGTDRFTTGIEPMGAAWSWDFYSYWMHMRGNPGGPQFWGNDFHPNPPVPISCDEWIAVELMIQLNDPLGAFNGEQAFWVNGQLAHHLGEGFPRGDWVWDKFHPDPAGDPFEGFQWRVVDALRVNFFWLLYYITQGPNGQTDHVLFDDVVVATEYIGPIHSEAPLLKAAKLGADVRLIWSDTGAGSYTLLRSTSPDLANPEVRFEGAALETLDPGAATGGPDFYYQVE